VPAQVVALHRDTTPLEQAAESFLAGADLAATSRRVYRLSLRRLVAGLGPDLSLAELDTPLGVRRVTGWFSERYGSAAPATWNRELATIRSVFGRWRTDGLMHSDPTEPLHTRTVKPDRTRALTRTQIEALWERDVDLRERTLWRLLYETCARANEILALDVEDLDLPNKRATVLSKGGSRDWVFWQTGAAMLLPRLLAGRTRGPVFLSTRMPTGAVPTLDLDPRTGHARLSYRRAAEMFTAATGGWTLHQLRHSALTHAAEDGTNTPMLLARSRHASTRSLERYARPSADAVARHVAANDPARRRAR
jgi:integrase